VTAPFAWWLAAIAAAFAALAIDASATYSISVPAAVAAVVVATLAVGDAVRRVRRAPAVASAPRPVPHSAVRERLGAGPWGREELLLFLDRLERRSGNPMLASRTPAEIAAIVRLPPEAFRRYVSDRLAPLEGTT
jgi:hypothetical protein